MLLFVRLGINFSNTIFSVKTSSLFATKEGRSARTYGVIKQTRSRAEKTYREEKCVQLKKVERRYAYINKEREREREREKEREREIS